MGDEVRSLETAPNHQVSCWGFFFHNDADSIAPTNGALGAALMVLGLFTVLPLGLAASGAVALSPWLLAWAVISVFVAACIPRRIVLANQGVMLLLVFGRNRRLREPGQSRWWGNYIAWQDVISVTRMKNHHRSRARHARLGDHRYLLRLRRHGKHEIHEAMPAHGSFDRLIRKHIPEKIRDVSASWWSWLQ